MDPEEIRNKAFSLGYDDVGITSAKIPDADIQAYKKWVKQGKHAGLSYMENELRCCPDDLLPGAKTAILFVSFYKQEKVEFHPEKGLIASYARGRDYHNLHRKRLKKFINWLETKVGKTGIAIGFSDSKPLLEKALAVQAGLGWFGKNTLLIHRRFGTFTLLSGILTTLEIPAIIKEERKDRCGSCSRCIDSCPTNALSPYELDAAKCLSYHLIESKEPIPSDIVKKNPGYVFGCDICQDVCPHNVRKPLSKTDAFSSEIGMGCFLDLEKLEEIEENPKQLYGSPLNRRGANGLRYSFDTWKER